jgi:hypothetical protein
MPTAWPARGGATDRQYRRWSRHAVRISHVEGSAPHLRITGQTCRDSYESAWHDRSPRRRFRTFHGSHHDGVIGGDQEWEPTNYDLIVSEPLS